MAGLSRRGFMGAVGALAGAWAIAPDLLGRRLAAGATASDAATTLGQTIRMTGPTVGQYRTLVPAAGEPYIARLDVIGRRADPERASRRRSLLYLGHFSDIHIMDPQSPARLDPLAGQDHALWAGVVRPQDMMTVHVTAAMVDAVAEARRSPLTGAPMAAALVTGDSADMHSQAELEWYITTLDGGTVLPNTGAPGVYEGVQVWSEATYAWHPDDPSGDDFGAYGFPTVPGVLDAVVRQEVVSAGLPVPWYAVYGNHDTLLLGTIALDSQLRALATSGRKASLWPSLAVEYLGGLASTGSLVQRGLDAVMNAVSQRPGIRAVTPDPLRKLFEQREFMAAHLASPAVPGPVGHGFTQANLDTGQTWWKADVGAHARIFGLDTCNQVAGPDGAVPADQFDWLVAELDRCAADRRMAIICSHHNSTTLENDAVPVVGSAQKLYHAEEFVAMLVERPVVVAWINGHTHINTITPHLREGGGGFWEITTASCIDFPQQQQLIELVDNRDGTMSVFTTAMDHASDAVWAAGDYSQRGLASLSRQLSANDWVEFPAMRLGSALDRNCELLLDAPFDLSTITDADLELARAADEARLLAYEQARATGGQS
jgi:metallophosphoesterase (TIGR03767 family)